ncbi:MAG TPA: hypothetical protein VFJ59_14130 [Pseudolabrys sp.]|nr:hypothetical protein [Pseudolabrys sp.]
MNRQFARSGLGLIVLALNSAPAFARHVMGGRMAATFGEGILSGLGPSGHRPGCPDAAGDPGRLISAARSVREIR